MATKSLSNFISVFAKEGRTEEGYGNYYTISGPTTDILLYFDEEEAREKLTNTAVSVVLIRTKTSDGKLIMFYNYQGVQSKRRSDRYTPSDAAKTFASLSFALPGKILDVSEDLSNLQVIDYNDYDVLIELPSGKYLITCLPERAVNKHDLLTFVPINSEGHYKVIVSVSSTTMVASKQALIPEGIRENDQFIAGVWLIDQGKKDIVEFNPTFEEIADFNNKPMYGADAPYYDALLGMTQNYSESFNLKFGYGVPYKGEAANYIPELDEIVNAFRIKLQAWRSRVDVFVKKYLAFNKDLFFAGSDRELSSTVEAIAQYYNDGVHSYVKGMLSNKPGYAGNVPVNAVVLKNWHQMFSITGKSQLL